jgi:hypothetical protein
MMPKFSNLKPQLQTAPHLSWINHCRSLDEILAAGFSYDVGIVTCSVCGDKKSSGSFITQLPLELSLVRMNICQRNFQAKKEISCATLLAANHTQR